MEKDKPRYLKSQEVKQFNPFIDVFLTPFDSGYVGIKDIGITGISGCLSLEEFPGFFFGLLPPKE
jgi:hypothetical protein